MSSRPYQRLLRTGRGFALAALTATLLAGCGINRTAATGSLDTAHLTGVQAQMAVPELAARFAANPADRVTGIFYATALRNSGQPTQAITVMESLVSRYPDDRDVALAFAKALTADGRFQQALAVAENATDPLTPHWEALSVRGAILDQLGEHAAARQGYQQALLLAPGEASLRANLGLSYAMTGDLTRAEAELRQAVVLPGASSQVRQNLALVIGLQGRFSEAQAIYAAELPPEEVAANMAYIRTMLSQQNRWSQVSQG